MTEPFVIGIGNKEAQEAFLRAHKNFLDEYFLLRPLVEKVFLNRVINPPSPEAISAVADLPDNDPQVQALEDRYKAELIVYTLGRIALDDFFEIIVLAGNGWGVGALKIMRGMYERAVTAAYIGNKPEASRAFADNVWTHRSKVWNRLKKTNPKLAAENAADIEEIEKEAKLVQERKNESICKKCGQLKEISAWTALDLFSMAEAVGDDFANLYLYCYLEPTSHMHATGAGTSARIKHTGDAWTYKIESDDLGEMALVYGHRLLLLNLWTQIQFFNLELSSEMKARFDGHENLWNPYFAEKFAETGK
jgi:uncharacterized protein DUF5677